MIFGSNIDANLTATESKGALSNNLLARCVSKVLGCSLNFTSWETLTKSFDCSSLSFVSAANKSSSLVFDLMFYLYQCLLEKTLLWLQQLHLA